jgi:hypothetical protein
LPVYRAKERSKTSKIWHRGKGECFNGAVLIDFCFVSMENSRAVSLEQGYVEEEEGSA